MRLISSSRAATRRRASFTAFSSLFMPIQLEQQDYNLRPLDFTPVSVTIFSLFGQKSCYRLTNAANFRPPLTFDASWREKAGKQWRQRSTRSSPLGSYATLRHLILFGGDSTPFTKRSQHFATESTFHRNVNISPQPQVKRFQPFYYRVDF